MGNGVRWRYFSHACILVETRGASVIFDPVLSYTCESQASRFRVSSTWEYIVASKDGEQYGYYQIVFVGWNK